MNTKIRNYLLSRSDKNLNDWMTIHFILSIFFVIITTQRLLSVLTVIIIGTIMLWVGFGFILVTSYVKTYYDQSISRLRKRVLLSFFLATFGLMLAFPTILLLMYCGIVPFPE